MRPLTVVAEPADLINARPMWDPRIHPTELEERIATLTATRVHMETGIEPTDRIIDTFAIGVRAVLYVLDERIPLAGPLPGHTGQLGLERVRDRHRPFTGLLRDWLDCPPHEARWLSHLMTGQPSWDGARYGSSAAWAATSYTPFIPIPATTAAALGWARSLHRLIECHSPTTCRPTRIINAVSSHRTTAQLGACS